MSDELKRNRVKGRYDSSKANHKAYVRRQQSKYQGMHIVREKDTKKFVDAGLLDDLSPQAIAGRLKMKEKNIVGISKDSIYRYIQCVWKKNRGTQKKQKTKEKEENCDTSEHY